eukprot:3099701-Pyramimonas_sp.AAC.1
MTLLDKGATTALVRLVFAIKPWKPKFAKALADVVKESVVIMFGRCGDPAAAFYRRVVLAVCAGTDTTRSKQLLAYAPWLPNGRWWNRNRVEVYLPDNTIPEELTKLMCSTAIVRAFCGQSWKIFNRGRWLDNDEAVSSVLALELCHGLLTKAFYRMIREYFPREAHLIREDVDPIVPMPGLLAIEGDAGAAPDDADGDLGAGYAGEEGAEGDAQGQARQQDD